LLTKYLKEVHDLVAKKAKLRKLSTFERSFPHQNHAKMNICILGNVMAVQKQNDQKVATCVHNKTQCEWDELIIVPQWCP
jgi:hypothetical protein